MNKFEKISSNTLNRNLSDSIDSKYNYETEYAFNEKNSTGNAVEIPLKSLVHCLEGSSLKRQKKYMKVTIL